MAEGLQPKLAAAALTPLGTEWCRRILLETGESARANVRLARVADNMGRYGRLDERTGSCDQDPYTRRSMGRTPRPIPHRSFCCTHSGTRSYMSGGLGHGQTTR